MSATSTAKWDYTEHAQAYLARPMYPAAMIEHLRSHASIDPASTEIVEIGAGTGKMTLCLAEGHSGGYTAVEPCDAMRELGQQETKHLKVKWIKGTGETTTLPDASADYVMLAQCFDTMDRPAALNEIARVLRPGGCLTVLWNHREWDGSAVESAIEGVVADVLGGYKRGARRENQSDVLLACDAFGDLDYHEASHSEVMSADRYADVWRSVRTLKVQAGDRFDEIIDRIKGVIGDHGLTEVPVSYTTRAWTVRRA